MFCAGVVGSTGTKYNPTGQVGFTVARLSGYAAGVWTITFAAHPLGVNYNVSVTGRGVMAYVANNPAPTSTAFSVITLAPGTSTPAVDGVFSFMVLAS